jgi:hypothetical protein
MDNTLDEMGFVRLSETVFEENKSDIESLRKLAERRTRLADLRHSRASRGFLRLLGKKPGKKFLIELLNKNDCSGNGAIKNLSENQTLKKIVENYLGEKAVLSGCGLWYSKASKENLSKSQLFHFDHGKPRTRIKVFIPLKKITKDNGAFCFFDAVLSSTLKDLSGSEGKFSDDQVFNLIDKQCQILHEGEVGDAMVVDTMRCLHQGSRIEKGNRLLVMLAFSNTEAEHKFSNKFVRN